MFWITEFFDTDAFSKFNGKPFYVGSVDALNKRIKANASQQGQARFINASIWDRTHDEAGHVAATAAILEYDYKGDRAETERAAAALPYQCFTLNTEKGFALVFPFDCETSIYWGTYTRIVALLAHFIGQMQLIGDCGALTCVIEPSSLPRGKWLNYNAAAITMELVDAHRNVNARIADWVSDKRRRDKLVAATLTSPHISTLDGSLIPVPQNDWFTPDNGVPQPVYETGKRKAASKPPHTTNKTLNEFFVANDDRLNAMDSRIEGMNARIDEMKDALSHIKKGSI